MICSAPYAERSFGVYQEEPENVGVFDMAGSPQMLSLNQTPHRIDE
jgi:hypothetical protein